LQLCSSAYEEVTNFDNDYRFDLGYRRSGDSGGAGGEGAKQCGRLLCSNLKLPQSSFFFSDSQISAGREPILMKFGTLTGNRCY